LLIARELDDEPAPLLVLLRIGIGGVLRLRLQLADRVHPRPRHPVLLGIADATCITASARRTHTSPARTAARRRGRSRSFGANRAIFSAVLALSPSSSRA